MTPLRHTRMIIVVLCSICAIMLFAGCQGVSGGATTISGKILSVNSTAHSVTMQGSVNGQQQTLTISGLTDQQIAALNGKTGNYSFQVIPNGTNYTLSSNSEPVSLGEATPESVTPEATTGTTSTGNTQGNISFTGKVQSISGTNLVVLMPNGNPLSMTISNNGNNSENSQLPKVGQQVKIKADANLDGSFQASEIKNLDNEQNNDLNTMSFTGITTSAVGTDSMLHFKVGSQSFSALINNNTQLKNVSSAQAIGNNQGVKVDASFTGSNGNALQIEIGND